MEGQEKKPIPAAVSKRSYHRPELIIYGNIPELTKSVDDHGGADGASHGNTKT